MERCIVGIIGSLFLLFLMATSSPAQATKTFTGEITNENLNCVPPSMKVPDGITVKNEEECILFWTYWKGEPYVLYDAATKTAYHLDAQNKVIPFIGKKVMITGTENNQMIKITEIKAEGNMTSEKK